MVDWQFWLLVVWLLFIGYCFGRAHEAWNRFSRSIDELQKLSKKFSNEE